MYLRHAIGADYKVLKGINQAVRRSRLPFARAYVLDGIAAAIFQYSTLK